MLPLPLLLLATSLAAAPDAALALHPENPHYFVVPGQARRRSSPPASTTAPCSTSISTSAPTSTSCERCGFNLTRTFSGTYREVARLVQDPGQHAGPESRPLLLPMAGAGRQVQPRSLRRGLLQPAAGLRRRGRPPGDRRGVRALLPALRGLALGREPDEREEQRQRSRQDPPDEVLTLKHPDLLERQLAFVRKVVTELNGFDNVYFEICNEPYFGGVTLDWQHKVADASSPPSRDLPNRHLIAQNIANGKAEIKDPHPAVSIFNFHYASPPDAVGMNSEAGQADRLRRDGLPGHGRPGVPPPGLGVPHGRRGCLQQPRLLVHPRPGGRHPPGWTTPTPGGGGRSLRKQLGILKDFLGRFDFVNASEGNALVLSTVPGGLRAEVRALADRAPGLLGALRPSRPQGRAAAWTCLPRPYHAEWTDPRDGKHPQGRRLDVRGRGPGVWSSALPITPRTWPCGSRLATPAR